MDTVKVFVGDITYHSNGVWDYLRPVEFVGKLIKEVRDTDSRGDRGITESLYELEDGGYIVYRENWSNWQGEVTTHKLIKVSASDLDVGGDFEFLGREAGFARALTLEEALSE